MIAFDNGPAGGDYARYIDDLMRAAADTSARTAAGPPGRPGGDLDRAATGYTPSVTLAPAARRPDGTPLVRPSMNPAPSRPNVADATGFVEPTPAGSAAARAAAIASALMSGEIVRRSSTGRDTMISLGAIVLGLVLVVVGVVWPAATLAVILAGGALMAWGGRRLRDAARQFAGPSSTPSPPGRQA